MSVPARRASILYDGVDIAALPSRSGREAVAAGVRAEFGVPAGASLVAMFARVNPQKDYETLIRSAAILRQDQAELRYLIVGDNDRVALNREHFERVRALARAAGVLDCFIFAGFRQDTYRLMLAADVCVLCTHFEGLPLVLLEAMAMGRPCVATAVDGVPEALTDGDTGLLHAHGDAEGLATAIRRLIGAPAAAAAFGDRARACVEARFSQQRFARDAYALYEGLAHLGRRSGRRVAGIGAPPSQGWRNIMTAQLPPPRVSVIVPAYGLAHFLGEALASLRAQTFQDWEAIVVDDGAPDDSPRRSRPFRRTLGSICCGPTMPVWPGRATGASRSRKHLSSRFWTAMIDTIQSTSRICCR